MRKVTIGEQETIVTMMRGEEKISIYTADSLRIAQFDKFVSADPTEWELLKEDEYGKTYIAPARCVKFKPVSRRAVTEKQLAALRTNILKQNTK